MTFRGYSLIQLNRAVDENTGDAAFTYEVTIHDVLGRVTEGTISCSELDRDWCKLRMNGARHAVRYADGRVKVIEWAEWYSLANPK